MKKFFKNDATLWVTLLVITLLSAFLTLFAGRYPISPREVVQILMHHSDDAMKTNIVRNIRLPRMLLTLLVGAGLAVSGASFQGIFQNPLVSPDVLSVSSGASFGAVLGIMAFHSNSFMVTLLAFVFGGVSVFMTYQMSKVKKETTTLSLVLAGMVMQALFNALVTLMKYVADTDTQLPAITYWLIGSFAAVTYREVKLIVIPVVLGISVLIAMRYKINILSIGDEEARSLGVSPARDRMILISAATLVTAACITVTGIIGWVGLVIPHIARMIAGPNHNKVLGVSALVGATYMTLMDLLARSATATEIPVGVLTALIGAPFFIFIFKKTGGMGE